MMVSPQDAPANTAAATTADPKRSTGLSRSAKAAAAAQAPPEASFQVVGAGGAAKPKDSGLPSIGGGGLPSIGAPGAGRPGFTGLGGVFGRQGGFDVD